MQQSTKKMCNSISTVEGDNECYQPNCPNCRKTYPSFPQNVSTVEETIVSMQSKALNFGDDITRGAIASIKQSTYV